MALAAFRRRTGHFRPTGDRCDHACGVFVVRTSTWDGRNGGYRWSRVARWPRTGLRRRSTPGGAAALAAAVLLYRGATGQCHVYQALGVDSGKGTGAIATVTPIHGRGSGGCAAYTWTPQSPSSAAGGCVPILARLRKPPQVHGAPGGSRGEGSGDFALGGSGPGWPADRMGPRVINELENRLIAWQSLEGSMVATAGSVNFSESVLGTTLRVRFRYRPSRREAWRRRGPALRRGAEPDGSEGPAAAQTNPRGLTVSSRCSPAPHNRWASSVSTAPIRMALPAASCLLAARRGSWAAVDP